MDEYQNRKDIDKIYDDLYDRINGSLNVVAFTNESKYRNISSKSDGSDRGTIDAIIDYYGLTEKGGGGDLSDYYTKTEINTILSSYVTSQTLEDYALKSELFSGSYNDLTDVPSSFPPSTHSHNWNSITDKPSSFPPSSHNHTTSQITDLNIPTKTSDLTNDGADGTNIFVSDNDSRLSDARTPTSHTHTKSNITDFAHSHLPTEVSDDSSDYPNIYRYSLPSIPSTVKSTLGAIDIALGKIVELPPFEIVSVLPTASDDTMGKLYFLSSNNKVDVYYTERSGNWQNYSYSWQKVDLNISWSDIQSKPSDFPPSSHTHDDRYYTESEIDTALGNKQATLVSGTNIKTINNESILGNGNITIQTGGTVDSSMSTTSTNALQNKVITNVVRYEITSSNYNPAIDSTITITVKALNQLDNTVSSHSLTLTLPDGTTTSLTTNSSGVATYTYTCSSWGVCRFGVGSSDCFINVKGWKEVGTKTVSGVTYTARVDGNGMGVMEVSCSNVSLANGSSHSTNLNFITDGYRPKASPVSLNQRSVSNNIIVYLWASEVGLTNTYSSSQTVSFTMRIPYFYY